MTDDTRCIAEDCVRLPVAKGLCHMHYRRLRRHGSTALGVERICASCGKPFWTKQHRTRNCEPCAARLPWARNVRRYGLSAEEALSMLDRQGGVCAICGCEPSGPLAVDHDHSCCPGRGSCGKCVRGLLCSQCNWALGCMEDSAERLRSAAEYLDKSNQSLKKES